MTADSGSEFVSEMIAMDRAWLAGTFDQWLEKKRKEVLDGLGDDDQGTVEGEAEEELDASPVSP